MRVMVCLPERFLPFVEGHKLRMPFRSGRAENAGFLPSAFFLLDHIVLLDGCQFKLALETLGGALLDAVKEA